MKKLLVYTLLLALAYSCKEEDFETYPPVVKEFITMRTGPEGKPSMILTDDNKTFLINSDKTELKLKGNTNYRMVSNYQPIAMPNSGSYGMADLYTATGVFTSLTIPGSEVAGGFKTDPVKVVRIWKSGMFINIEIAMPAGDKDHTFAFVNEGYNYTTKKSDIKLAHNNNGDSNDYTKNLYMSLQLMEFYNTCDSIDFHIYTPNGWETYAFSVK